LDFVSLAELVLGPLMLARVPHLAPAPTGIVVRPDAPELDMTVVGVPEQVTNQRPQPKRVVASGSPPEWTTTKTVWLEPQVTLASPEALDRIDAELDQNWAISVYPWHKTAKRYEALSMFFVLASAMTTGAFTALPLRPRRVPHALLAENKNIRGSMRVFGGGHIVAERPYPDGVHDLVNGWTRRIGRTRAAHPLALLCTIAFFYGAALTAMRLILDPSWAHFGWYAAYAFAISLCLRQVGKFARLATAIYPVTLAFFLVIALRSSLTMRADRVRAARAGRP
jgi:hypothetical protein